MGPCTFVGASSAQSWETAGREASEKALALAGGSEPKFLLVMSSEDADYSQVYKGVRMVSKLPVMGGLAGWLYTREGVITRGVAVAACCWDGELVGPFAIRDDSDLERVKDEVRGKLSESQEGYNLTFFTMWSQKEVIGISNYWYNFFGPETCIAGGCCENVVFNDMISNSTCIVAVFLSGNNFKTVVGHGWKPQGKPAVITKSDKNYICEIDGIQAVQRYKKLCREAISRLGEKPIDDNAAEWSFAFGFPTVSGEHMIHITGDLHEDEGKIEMGVNIPENSVVRLMSANLGSLYDTTEKLIDEYFEQFDYEPGFNIVINCAGRIYVLGQHMQKEADLIINKFGNNMFLGFASVGELCVPKGMPVYHYHKSLVLLGA